jgi:inosine/xanthosine triphosphate pyrophosphatase family protein
MRLIAATRNPTKVEELARLVAGLAEVVPLPIAGAGDAEDGDSLLEIADGKAVSWSRRLDGEDLVVATDGGLLIPALGDRWQPTQTRRFAGEARSDDERAEALLVLAAGLDGDERRIVWEEALAVARGGVLLAHWVANGPAGLLAREVDPVLVARGNGFWIPAIWVCPEMGGRRLAELTATERGARADHWSKLGAKLRAFLLEHGEESPAQP